MLIFHLSSFSVNKEGESFTPVVADVMRLPPAIWIHCARVNQANPPVEEGRESEVPSTKQSLAGDHRGDTPSAIADKAHCTIRTKPRMKERDTNLYFQQPLLERWSALMNTVVISTAPKEQPT